MSRLRQAVAFLAGFLVGVVVLYVLLLWKGQLVRGPLFVSTPAATPPTTVPTTLSTVPSDLFASPSPPFPAPSAPSSAASAFEATPIPFTTPAPWAPEAEAPLAVPDVPNPPHALPAPPPDVGDFARLETRNIAIPVQGVDASQLRR